MKKIDWQSSTAHSQAGIQIQRLKDQIKKLTQKANGYQLKMNAMIQELNALRTEKSSWNQHIFQQTILDQEQNDVSEHYNGKNGTQYVFFQARCQVNFLMTRHLDGKTFVIFSLMPKFFLFISKLLIFFFLYFIFVFWKTL
ncbi:hypothetical protein TRFO_06899 [Tritrichomonas foetus]|uniref:Uncharacterized protein n=1 Tax=Tritrichomonas foetus TaxID=1144522 RepID=A0A1J4K028_9EUKA|nr:hypothetical protein TRFO_06899 [Tritrichomonas foetus]|eukprot:OHT02861.1 hypothetical protein TRFO_06899 [Tritrichomonas foetus]